MNTNNIKKYAPQARNQFRDAVTQKLTTLGISADKKGNLQIADAELVGETVRYGQFDYPKSTLTRRDRLVKRAASRALMCWLSTVPTPGSTACAPFVIWKSTVILTTASVCSRTRITRQALKCWTTYRKSRKHYYQRKRRSWSR